MKLVSSSRQSSHFRGLWYCIVSLCCPYLSSTVLPEQRCGEAVLRPVVQGAVDHAGLRAVGALRAELPAAAARAQHAPRLAAQLHAATSQRSTTWRGLFTNIEHQTTLVSAACHRSSKSTTVKMSKNENYLSWQFRLCLNIIFLIIIENGQYIRGLLV